MSDNTGWTWTMVFTSPVVVLGIFIVLMIWTDDFRRLRGFCQDLWKDHTETVVVVVFVLIVVVVFWDSLGDAWRTLKTYRTSSQ